MRPIPTAFLTFALLLTHIAGAVGQPPTCRGKSMLDELKGTPEHAAILAKAAATENAGALLWRIERDGKPPSHLFGTMHLTDERIATFSPALKGALAGSRHLLLEVDAEDLTPNGVAKALLRARPLLTFNDGRRLDRLLSETEYAKAVGILEQAGVPAQAASLFKPWVAAMMLALSDCERQRTAHGLVALDQRLAREGASLGIAIEGLESLDLQFRAMADVPEADQLQMLRAGLRMYDRVDDMIETTVQLYLARQLGAIWPLQLALSEKVGVPPAAFDAMERNLLARRNLGMRDKALPFLDRGGVMIAVGALHLPGKQGLVALLRDAGYTVSPIE